MYDFSFLEAIKDNDVVPGPFDKTQAEAMLADFLAEHGGEAPHETVIPDLCAHPGGRRILLAVFGNSPFLSRLVFRDPLFLAKLSLQGPENSMAETSRDLKELAQADLSQEELGRRLRRLRGQAALTIAVADITGYWELPQVLQALSDFAQAVLQCVVAPCCAPMPAQGMCSSRIPRVRPMDADIRSSQWASWDRGN
jgi:glutamine synthetase adenylyltransferase